VKSRRSVLAAVPFSTNGIAHRIIATFLLAPLFLLLSSADNATVKIGLLQYNGGGDWYANPTSLPNLIRFCNKELRMNLHPEPVTVPVGSTELFNFPFVHMTGHGNVVFQEQELQNLRLYLSSGGFLHIDDNYGMDPYIRPQLEKLFPGETLTELPFSHPLFHQMYDFPRGLPKIHEHDLKAPQAFGLFHEGRLVVVYTFECDLGDGWENPEIHRDPEETRLKALKMGANLIQFAFTQ
jgi:hypothetical protein